MPGDVCDIENVANRSHFLRKRVIKGGKGPYDAKKVLDEETDVKRKRGSVMKKTFDGTRVSC